MSKSIYHYWEDLTDTGGPSKPYWGTASEAEQRARVEELYKEYHAKLGDYMGADLKWCKRQKCKHLSYCDGALCCLYILHTEKPRPCEAGEGCTVYERRAKDESKRRFNSF